MGSIPIVSSLPMTASEGADDAGLHHVTRAGLDHVTGLHVRSTFERRLATLLERHQARPAAGSGVCSAGVRPDGVWLVICDVVGLKEVNEGEGFRRGDAVLTAAAEHFCMATKGADLQARLGGDELVAVFIGPESAADAARAVRQLSLARSPELRTAATAIHPHDTSDGLIDRLYAAMRTS